MAAILWERHTPWSVEEIELDPPKAGEVLVKLAASGMCHSDEHIVTGDLAGVTGEPPCIGGHEGAGVILEVGPGVTSLQVGDHVVFSFLPACGRCPSCASGHSNLCDLGGVTAGGLQLSDGTSRHHARGQDLRLAIGCLGTFAHHTVVNEASCVKIEKEWPLDRACLLGCGVVTGWGSAVYAAQVEPGDMVAVVGAGGIGSNVIQGARLAGARVIAAIDPVEFKRQKAKEFGATHTYASVDEALGDLASSTWNRGFNKVIMTMGVGDGEVLGKAFWLASKGSKIVVTNIHPTLRAVDLDPRCAVDAAGEATDRLAVRFGEHAQGHPDVDGAVHPGAARPRSVDHPHLSAGGDQRRLCRHERRQEHPRRADLRVIRR